MFFTPLQRKILALNEKKLAILANLAATLFCEKLLDDDIDLGCGDDALLEILEERFQDPNVKIRVSKSFVRDLVCKGYSKSLQFILDKANIEDDYIDLLILSSEKKDFSFEKKDLLCFKVLLTHDDGDLFFEKSSSFLKPSIVIHLKTKIFST